MANSKLCLNFAIIMKDTLSNQSRRKFIKILSSIVLLSGFLWTNCTAKKSKRLLKNTLTSAQEEILLFVLYYIWPENNNIPTVKEIGIPHYIKWYLNDDYIDPEEKQYFLKGLTWVEESAGENYGNKFENLDNKQRFELFETIKNTEWGESWLSSVMTLLVEAMFADPLYHSNPDGLVWKWLDHDPGQPRPNKFNKYPVILSRKKETSIITDINQIL